ncbi:MAG: regulator of chromosome condensation [Myxococcales bacterium]|nr:regulator of chromosome condensation [Myxococcales bacterium]
MKIAIFVLLAACSRPGLPANDELDQAVRLAAGQKHACWIDPQAQLWCWGNNGNRQLGVSVAPRTGAPQIATSGSWIWVAAGARHTCAINTDGELYCWGDNTDGQVGNFAAADVLPSKVALPGDVRPAKVFAGDVATCAIDDAGLLYCWGIFDSGRTSAKPVQVKPGMIDGPWRTVAIADDHACALHDGDNLVYCWGKDDAGQLGVDNDRASDQASPKPDRAFVAISASHGATCGVTVDRELVCFGSNARGLIGPQAAPTKDVLVDASHRWTAVALGTYHTCAVGDGDVNCFGTDDRGALGDDFEARTTLPPTPMLPAERVVAGEGFSCSVADAGIPSCWGANAYGELGNQQIATKHEPELVMSVPGAKRIAVGDGHTCVVTTNNIVYCWGDNRVNQINATSSSTIVRPTAVSLTTSYVEISAGSSQTCGIDANDNTWLHCWGSNDAGLLGTATGEISAAVVTGTQAQWKAVSAGVSTICAVTSSGQLACWGVLPGQSAGGASPTVATDTLYTNIAVGDGFAVSSFTGNPVNQQDDVAQIGSTSCSAATTFPGRATVLPGQPATTWRLAAATSGQHACAIRDSTATALFCWGANTSGETGVAPTECQPPMQIPAIGSPWATGSQIGSVMSVVSVADGHSCAINSANNAYCWGANRRGELGDLSDGYVPHVIKISGTPAHFDQIATAAHHTCAINGTAVYCWGENRFGELGDGESFHPEPHAIAVPQ